VKLCINNYIKISSDHFLTHKIFTIIGIESQNYDGDDDDKFRILCNQTHKKMKMPVIDQFVVT